jgi:hypothetical protein
LTMTGAVATIDDGAWTAIKHTGMILDEDPSDGGPTRSGLNVLGQLRAVAALTLPSN